MEIRELSFRESRELLYKFQVIEQSYGTDWFEVEEPDAKFIWIIENLEDPRGFLSYKAYVLPESQEFLYIVKIYVLKSHRGEEATLINEERVSQILFRQIESKGIKILTLESSDERLDEYYRSLGFEYNAEISRIYASVIDTRNRKIIFRDTRVNISELVDEEKLLFGN